jgi:hypothetical protein
MNFIKDSNKEILLYFYCGGSEFDYIFFPHTESKVPF